jgi:hypothetical protein
MLDNIPTELRILPQWVVAGTNKIPLTPRTGQVADPTDSRTWGTFDEARAAGYPHVGFVLHRDDPYTIIDLDDPTVVKLNGILQLNEDAEEVANITERHRKIYNAFHSYSEVSQSGKGVHIVVRGRLPSGVRRDKVELYSQDRYMIFTGQVIRQLPIVDAQEMLDIMHREMASTVIAELEEKPQVLSDEAVMAMASGATNAAKFDSLWRGDQNGYSSQSEADFALLTILCFYSKANDQVRRLFRNSALGKREKATKNNDYIDRALSKIRARQMVPSIDLSALLSEKPVEPSPPQQLELLATTESCQTPYYEPPKVPQAAIAYPPGLIGEMADYIYSSAYRPVPEIALVAAVALGAGIAGRNFNISSTGLNQYLILLAQTGTGKEGAAHGMEALINSIHGQLPAADQFIGPAVFASGQALTRIISKTPCFVSILGEFGLTLKQMCDRHAPSHLLQLRKVLLDVFAKSGWNRSLKASVYSDSERDTEVVRAPNVTILGESTPQNFYGALDVAHISEGLIPRFFVVEYDGQRPPPNAHAFHHPKADLSSKLLQLVQTVISMQHNQSCCPVQIDYGATELLDTFNAYADTMINRGEDEITRQLWNRAHIKALKLAGLIAVGCGHHQPVVTKEVAQWAIDVVTRDILNMLNKFNVGLVGEGDHQLDREVRSSIERYEQLSSKQRVTNYSVPKAICELPRIIPYVFLRRWCQMRAPFKNDRRGASNALTATIADMIKADIIKQVPPQDAKNQWNIDAPVYYRGDSW